MIIERGIFSTDAPAIASQPRWNVWVAVGLRFSVGGEKKRNEQS